MNLDDFQLERAAVHYVPTAADEEEPELLLTDEVIELDAGLNSYFRDKVVDRLKSKGLDVVGDPDQDQTVSTAVADALRDPRQLITASQSIARHLDFIQTRVNSSCLLAILQGATQAGACVAIVKLERERGVRFAIDIVGGRHVVDLELLRNLTLTDKTKVYKTALLTFSDDVGVSGLVADDQRAAYEGVQVASFFLGQFLGCKPKEPAAKTTFEFVKAANDSFNQDVPSPETQGRYQVALLAVLQDNSVDIKPRTFASRHLEREDRPAFLGRMREAGIDPDRTFTKDPSLVRVDRFRMSFESGMVLVGDMNSLKERVQLPERNDAEQPVEVRDRVRNMLTGR